MEDPADRLTPDPTRLRALADDLDAEGLPDLAQATRRAADECDGQPRVAHSTDASVRVPHTAGFPKEP